MLSSALLLFVFACCGNSLPLEACLRQKASTKYESVKESIGLLASTQALHLEVKVVDASRNLVEIKSWVDDACLPGLTAVGGGIVELSTESGVVAKENVPLKVSVEAVGASPGERVFKARLLVEDCSFAHVEARWFATSNNSYWTPSEFSERIGAIGYPVSVFKGRGSYGIDGVELWGYGTSAALRVGNFSSFGPRCVALLGGNHRSEWTTTFPFPSFHPDAKKLVDLGNTDGPHATSKGDIVVGSDVWIGYGVTLLSGITIGHGAIVGARAVVAKSVPPYAVVVGNPARIVKYRFDNDTIAELLSLEWWKNWSDEEVIARFPHLLNAPSSSSSR